MKGPRKGEHGKWVGRRMALGDSRPERIGSSVCVEADGQRHEFESKEHRDLAIACVNAFVGTDPSAWRGILQHDPAHVTSALAAYECVFNMEDLPESQRKTLELLTLIKDRDPAQVGRLLKAVDDYKSVDRTDPLRIAILLGIAREMGAGDE